MKIKITVLVFGVMFAGQISQAQSIHCGNGYSGLNLTLEQVSGNRYQLALVLGNTHVDTTLPADQTYTIAGEISGCRSDSSLPFLIECELWSSKSLTAIGSNDGVAHPLTAFALTLYTELRTHQTADGISKPEQLLTFDFYAREISAGGETTFGPVGSPSGGLGCDVVP